MIANILRLRDLCFGPLGCVELLNAPEGACGTATAGGTESVMLAVKTARDHARRPL